MRQRLGRRPSLEAQAAEVDGEFRIGADARRCPLVCGDEHAALERAVGAVSRGGLHDVAVRTVAEAKSNRCAPAILRELLAKAAITAAAATHENVAAHWPREQNCSGSGTAQADFLRPVAGMRRGRAGAAPAKCACFCESDNAVA